MTDEPVSVEDTEYVIDINSLSDDAKAQFNALCLTDRKITDLQQQISIMQTAREAYARALAAAMDKI